MSRWLRIALGVQALALMSPSGPGLGFRTFGAESA